MKVIAVKGYHGNYIVEVSHTELEKVMGKHYGNLPRLDDGSVLDLGQGYDFRDAIIEACDSMIKGREAFDRKWESLMNFASLVVSNTKEKPEVPG